MSDTNLVALPVPEPSDLKRLLRYDGGVRVRALVEMALVRRIVMDVCSFEGRGYVITVDDGGDLPVKASTDVEAIVDAAFAVEECLLLVYTPTGNWVGNIYLVFGNSGWDSINDYHVCLEPALQGVNEYAEQLSAWF